MPLYRYMCDNCDHTFTVLEPINGNLLRVCERCGERAARRIISRVGVVYKGSGFHSTDYRRNGRGNHNKTEAEEGQEEKAR